MSVREWKRWPSFSSSARSSGVIVDLAVEDDDRVAVVGDHRLVAGLEIDDFQARRAQGNDSGLIYRPAVRSTVRKRFHRIPDAAWIGHTLSVSKPGDPTHSCFLQFPFAGKTFRATKRGS